METLRHSIIAQNIIMTLMINDYCLKKVVLKDIYRDYDLLYPQGGGFFFSERIVNAMQCENIVGYDLVKGGYFYEGIDFA